MKVKSVLQNDNSWKNFCIYPLLCNQQHNNKPNKPVSTLVKVFHI